MTTKVNKLTLVLLLSREGNVSTPVCQSFFCSQGKGVSLTETPLDIVPLDRDPMDRDPPDRDPLDRDPMYGNERAVRILLEGIVVLTKLP